MGRAGWFCWPPGAYGAGWYPGAYFPYGSPFYAPSREEEQAMLENQAKILEEQLEQVRARLKQLAKAGKEKKDEE
ncbi:MAG: DUF5320 domain-containing protein [Candidatus Aminicenantales bacterium]